MSADKVRFQENISKELEKLGCKRIERLDNENSLWITDWGIAITVPDFGKEDRCPMVWWVEVLASIEKT